MVVFPIKWLPWLFLIAGVYSLFSGEDVELGLILTVVGAAWLILRGQKKDNRSGGGSSQPSQVASPPRETNISTTTDVQKGQRAVFCPVCGTRAEDGAVFCANCGTKLNL